MGAFGAGAPAGRRFERRPITISRGDLRALCRTSRALCIIFVSSRFSATKKQALLVDWFGSSASSSVTRKLLGAKPLRAVATEQPLKHITLLTHHHCHPLSSSASADHKGPFVPSSTLNSRTTPRRAGLQDQWPVSVRWRCTRPLSTVHACAARLQTIEGAHDPLQVEGSLHVVAGVER